MDTELSFLESDDETLAGLTQVPNQINLEKEQDSEESDDGGLDELFSDEAPVAHSKSVFGLIPADKLVDTSQNQMVHFDSEVFAIGMEFQVSQNMQDKDCNLNFSATSSVENDATLA